MKLGQIEVVDPRSVWQHEERDFTPWLAENANMISEVIGIPIEIEQTEKYVGNFKLDILGKVENTDKVVVIENQLDESDHKHLGQLITYASGLNAAIIIWVTPVIRDEHKTAVEWLNDISSDEVSFFLLKPEVIRIDDSLPAIRFNLESGPSEFLREIREVTNGEDAPRHIFRKQFWSELFTYMAEKGDKSSKGRRTSKRSWIQFSVGKSGILVNACLAQNSKLRIELYLQDKLAEINTQYYHLLLENQEEIRNLFDREELIFDSMEGSKVCRLKIERSYDIQRSRDDEDYRSDDLFPWIHKNVELLKQVANNYLV
ncbi:DUF4268 domain-containing protein [Neobacillus drentensis]|uniref:DUF4268 domain-containing protein n=1 Tax=Neobacillus drentensis TaxID=220684 RepID=UPI003000DB3D